MFHGFCDFDVPLVGISDALFSFKFNLSLRNLVRYIFWSCNMISAFTSFSRNQPWIFLFNPNLFSRYQRVGWRHHFVTGCWSMSPKTLWILPRWLHNNYKFIIRSISFQFSWFECNSLNRQLMGQGVPSFLSICLLFVCFFLVGWPRKKRLQGNWIFKWSEGCGQYR